MPLQERKLFCNLADGSFFSGCDQPAGQQLMQGFSCKSAFQHTIFCHRDCAGLLRDNDHHCIGIFAHADGSTMPGAEALVDEFLFLRLRQKACCRQDLAVPDNHCAVMKRRFIEKDISKKLFTGDGVQDRAIVDLLAQSRLALDDDQRTGRSCRQFYTGITDDIDRPAPDGTVHIGAAAEAKPQFGVACFLQGSAKLRLKEDDQSDEPNVQCFRKQVGDRFHIDPGRDDVDQKQQKDTLDELSCPRFPYQLHGNINHIREHQDI